MNYVALLRKINVGTANRTTKKSLEEVFNNLGYNNVQIYINSGNVIFSTKKTKPKVIEEINTAVLDLFEEQIQFIVKTSIEMKKIGEAIPKEWQNDTTQKTDIAYLFAEVDRPEIVNELPFKKEYVQTIYVKGALIMNVPREYQFKSQYSKLVSSKIYKSMTVRNVNTARYLAGINE
jgi:uncharacterized protein (DUF1697 family)